MPFHSYNGRTWEYIPVKSGTILAPGTQVGYRPSFEPEQIPPRVTGIVICTTENGTIVWHDEYVLHHHYRSPPEELWIIEEKYERP